MKKIFAYIALALTAFSCKKDNYDPPSSTFSGFITYKGVPVNVSSKDVTFELWEPGWGKNGAITVNVKEDGSFSALLFDGNYKLIIPPSQGPFRSITDAETKTDTMLLTIRGNQEMNIEVMPYYMVREAKLALSGTDVVTGNFRLEKILTGPDERNIESVFLYLNQTQFVDGTNYIARTVLDGGNITDPANISMQVNIPDVISGNGATGNQDYVFARVGVKISGVEDLLFSEVQQINLK
ncbi:DUF3823 domain-containing protein [Chitinophaga rhizophila]|uniref:DUF3823 domain-containing protein n=1 Tax=Chitinophaga rhizophila TaxID=2866212 RepID=A0ABS7GGW1_9BACT|nr:DUF3823 domain-containing protein [Chitinophaga rhizophila]MBW8685723.1 DUF3823 domain-containing protein [Chitinophaga rhizophila]